MIQHSTPGSQEIDSELLSASLLEEPDYKSEANAALSYSLLGLCAKAGWNKFPKMHLRLFFSSVFWETIAQEQNFSSLGCEYVRFAP